MYIRRWAAVSVLALGALAFFPHSGGAAPSSFIGSPNVVSALVASTLPGNGDVNPYGVAVVDATIGSLKQGDVLVSNFNDVSNVQGTGTTIVSIAPDGKVSTFADLSAATLPGSCPGGVGLTTALSVFRSGWVVVGSLPTTDGTAATAKAGCLIVIDSHGKPVETISGAPINGPWDMTAVDRGANGVLFVTNVLNGTVAASPNVVNEGTVARIQLDFSRVPRVVDSKVIATGLAERTDPAALVVGPTGVAFDRAANTLYVADAVENRIVSVPNALDRRTASTGNVFSTAPGLNGPLGLTLIDGGHLVAANGGDGNLVELSRRGEQLATRTVDTTGAGTLFGITFSPSRQGLYFVDDGSNTLNLLARRRP